MAHCRAVSAPATVPTWIEELPRPLAFHFPGGGALGAYQAGALGVLTAHGLQPDLLCGVSAGGVNAALAAWHPGTDGTAYIEDVWRSLRRRDLLRIHPGRVLLAITGKRPSFVDNRYGRAFLRRLFGDRRIEDSPVPLLLIATDLHSGEAVTLRRGPLVEALMATAAFPGAYPPVELDGRLLIDGGVVADLPLDAIAAAGARTVLIIQAPDLSREEPPPTSAVQILLRSATFGIEAHNRSILRRPPKGLRVLEVTSPPTSLMTFSLGTADQVLHRGASAAHAFLARDHDDRRGS